MRKVDNCQHNRDEDNNMFIDNKTHCTKQRQRLTNINTYNYYAVNRGAKLGKIQGGGVGSIFEKVHFLAFLRKTIKKKYF